MHGGVKFYRGNAAAVRNYVEADRSRADDYYLAEGSGAAERYIATLDPAGSMQVTAGGQLDGDAYQAWVAGYTTEGCPKGRLRTDDQGLRFVEVVVNGPKTWSLAASVDPEISQAYDAAQARAATEIVDWLGEHSTTRVGPRGLQVQVPTEEVEAVVVRHYTSRAGDPHRHLHLQINARVFAAGKWRGLHTAGTRDQIEAINGIGHAAVMCDPEFRAVLTRRGYTLDATTGEILELAPFAPRFSARAAQIARNGERFEAAWRAEHPREEPGPGLRQAWDRRAWATARPDKVIPKDGGELLDRWREELTELGFKPPVRKAELGRPVWLHEHQTKQTLQAGDVERDAVAEVVIAVLGRAHSAWNTADIRGQVEHRLAALNLIAPPQVRRELAEDITARAAGLCVPLLPERGDVPAHVRSLTSPRVIAVEAEICRRMQDRAEAPRAHLFPHAAIAEKLDSGQLAVVSALVGLARMVVVEGPAGAGKTQALRATAASMFTKGHRNSVVVVAPTMKAAHVASTDIEDAEASSAAKLIHAHGYRWDDTEGRWWREEVNRHHIPAPYALSSGDLLVIDEAGMLDQDTTLALLTIADENLARVAFIGDRHQLPAVGRGGAFDHAISIAPAQNQVSLDTVHRFTEPAYAELTLRMRAGRDLGGLFDELLADGHIQIHGSEPERTTALLTASLAGDRIIADSREHVAALNAHLHDTHQQQEQPGQREELLFTTRAGETLAVGDQVATRHNDPRLGVANRDRWTLTHINPSDGTLTVRGERGTRTLPAAYAARHLELAYATTVHGAQGETVDRAHYALDETSRAAAVYVAMTRGRHHNTAHLIAETIDQARTLWMTAMSRGAADLGPAHARNLALEDIEAYGPMYWRKVFDEASYEAALQATHQPRRRTPSSGPDYRPSPSRGYGPSI